MLKALPALTRLAAILIIPFALVATACDGGGTSDPGEGASGAPVATGDNCTTNPCQNGGVCSSSETAYTCACPTGWSGETCTACDSRDVCDYDEICHASACEGVLGRLHRVTILNLEVGTAHPSGDGWDVLGGAPDLYVSYGIDGGDLCTTTKQQDVFSATWSESCEFTFGADDTFVLQVYDADLTGDDMATSWVAEGTDGLVAFAASGQLRTLIDGDITLTFSVTPLY